MTRKQDNIISAAGAVGIFTAVAGAATALIPVTSTMRGNLAFYEVGHSSMVADAEKNQPSFSNSSIIVQNESGVYKTLAVTNRARWAGLPTESGQHLVIVFSESLSDRLGLTHLGKQAQSILPAPA